MILSTEKTKFSILTKIKLILNIFSVMLSVLAAGQSWLGFWCPGHATPPNSDQPLK